MRTFGRTSVGFAVLALVLLTVHVPVETQTSQLTAAEVNDILRETAVSLNDATLAAAVVDRQGRILGVYARVNAGTGIPDMAVTLARTGAFFGNDEAPLGSRTVRFISGIHFPPGIRNTASAALYGIEQTNRGCQLGPTDEAPFERPRALAGADVIGSPRLPCRPDDTRGCARGGVIKAADGQDQNIFGFTTGKESAFDQGEPLNVPVNPGGAPIYRRGRVVGGVGIAGVSPASAEYAAFIGMFRAGLTVGLSPVSADPLPRPGAVFIDGIRLPYFSDCISVDCVRQRLIERPAGTSPGSFLESGGLIVSPRDGQAAPEGYLIGPMAGGALTADDVRKVVDQAVARANATRAQIRLPVGRTTRMVIGVSDETGKLLAAFRMPDSTVFSFDVAVTKARNAFYFSTAEGYNVLRTAAENRGYHWEPAPPAGQGWAVTARTLSFGGQPLFPPGIDLEKSPTTPGPFFDIFNYDLLNPCTEGPGVSRGLNRLYPNQSGIVWFPGSAALYKNGALVGGVGVSGDGVEQDDYVTAAAVKGFEPPASLRADQSVMLTEEGARVRMPYWKFPRNPELR